MRKSPVIELRWDRMPGGAAQARSKIVRILPEDAAAAKVSELHYNRAISDATRYKWKAMYCLTVSELRRLKDAESENSELKQLLPDPMPDNAGLKGLPARNF